MKYFFQFRLQECHLSEADRFSEPRSFVSKQGTDYLENQCESSKRKKRLKSLKC